MASRASSGVVRIDIDGECVRDLVFDGGGIIIELMLVFREG